jgi:hypothetical protein
VRSGYTTYHSADRTLQPLLGSRNLLAGLVIAKSPELGVHAAELAVTEANLVAVRFTAC